MIARRKLLLGASASVLVPATLAADSDRSLKKGWSAGNQQIHDAVGAHWYYNWTPSRGKSNIEFVPMIKGGFNVNEKQFSKISGYRNITHLLGYNEPERAKQGNLSLEKGVELWPRLVKLAEKNNLRLGSPAPSSDAGGMKWLDGFMEEARRRKLRVDFVALHWYRSRDASQFEAFIDDVARKYRLPVWITEFNGWSGSEEENYRFLKDSLRFLERHREVERYAYFEPGKGKPHSLFRPDGSLTRMGELYRDAGT